MVLDNIKKIGIAILIIIAFAAVIIIVIITAGKNKKIKDLLNIIQDKWKKNIANKEVENDQLDETWKQLTAQERTLIQLIMSEPNLHIPEEIDPKDYKAVLKWFRELEKEYD